MIYPVDSVIFLLNNWHLNICVAREGRELYEKKESTSLAKPNPKLTSSDTSVITVFANSWRLCKIMAAIHSKTSSDSKRGNLEKDDIQMPLKLVKELLKQQESTLKVFLVPSWILSTLELTAS